MRELTIEQQIQFSSKPTQIYLHKTALYFSPIKIAWENGLLAQTVWQIIHCYNYVII
jgi:hypothetical protein